MDVVWHALVMVHGARSVGIALAVLTSHGEGVNGSALFSHIDFV